jgi:hypothetical protein
MPAQNEAAGTGLINQAQLQLRLGELLEEIIDRVESSADDAVAAHFGRVLRSDRNRDGILVDV